MKINKIIPIFLIITLSAFSFQNCEKNEVEPTGFYDCQFNFTDTSSIHPKATIYQSILDENQKKGIVGAILLVKDKHGLWIGASGKSDIASNTDMKPCNTFLIASISKVFTAAAVYRYIDKGMLSMEDPVNKWISHAITDKIKNANEAKIKHLLSHTSGIADYYTMQFELDRLNRMNNSWTKEDMLEKFIYGKKPTNAVGETYSYSNTNYLLLSMILENVSGKSFEQVYHDEVFDPLQLSSAYYSESKPIPDGCVKGYADVYGNGQFAESRFLYDDELGIGGDGGIAINAYDLSVFIEKLYKGELISDSSLHEMTNWFPLPEEEQWLTYGKTENGYGLEKFNTDYGYAVGHTGGIDGFNTYCFYFPEKDMTYILFTNTASYSVDVSKAKENIFKSAIKEMFE